MTLPDLYLRRREERRLKAGHPWVYSNEVDTARSPLTALEAGGFVNVRAFNGVALGTAYANPRTLICARMVSRKPDRPLDRDALDERLDRALRLRERLFDAPCYRLVHAESDGLPGLIVDRHDRVVVVQIATAGMARLEADLLDALESRLHPAAIVLRNDAPGRDLEGLDQSVSVARGTLPETVTIVENGARFRVDPLGGQKTGWYYDHRLNRARMAAHVRGRRVLDLFCYGGAWGVQAALAGAAHVVMADESRSALEGALENAGLNGVSDRVETVAGDAFALLKSMHDAGTRFDVVIVDPPAFARRKRDLPAAIEAYRRLNRLAMGVLGEEGLLMSASCSSHVDAAALRDAIRAAGRKAGRRLQILEQGHQGPDHPVHPALADTEYLKWLLVRVLA